jgi:arylformamidase
MQPIYLSHFIETSTPVYGGAENTIKIYPERSIEKGDTSNNLSVQFPLHIGTHIDFPYHFSKDGKKCHDYPASFWIFNKIGFLNCLIDDVENKLDELPMDLEILILKTDFGNNRNEAMYWKEQPIIPAYFAELFKNKFPNIRVFGFDLISLTSKLDREEGKKAHINFLINNDILVLEDMNLSKLYTTPEHIYIAPLQIHSADGVPCNIIAFNTNNYENY